MQIDFHHAVTYVAARAAEFEHADAETIAYCAQYVDDAVQTGTITFQNKALYERICSAHKMADYRNMEALANHRVWIPFHFLPGNDGQAAGHNPGQHFIKKVICTKDSPVARDMIAACIHDRHKPFSLHRLGISLHVYADTWAHRDFAGINNEINDISNLTDASDSGLDGQGMLSRFFGNLFDKTASKLVGDVMPLGHGAALCFPDLPYLKWRYKDRDGIKKERNNTRDFIEAADHLCQAMKKYRAGSDTTAVSGLDHDYKEKIKGLFKELVHEEGDERHAGWITAIRDGEFPFGPEILEYNATGKKSWKHMALGTTKNSIAYPWDKAFLTCNWKYFHDALLDHQFSLIHDILPRYGICAA
jgi:hypothetical protein